MPVLLNLLQSLDSKMVPKVMRAVQYNRYGGGAAALKHVEVPVPSPKEGEVLLKSEAISLNPVEWKMQEGVMRPLFPRKFPHIPCSDVAGEVVQAGQGVNNFKVGDKVVATIHFLGGGALAEYVVAKQHMTVARPPQVPAADAAGLPIAGITALQALTQVGGLNLDGSATSNQTNVLITAASGGVGHYAVQLAKLGNAHVTATCGARNMDLVRSLGADEVLDYKTPEGAAFKSPSGRKYDVVVHCAASGVAWSQLERNLSEQGKVVDLSPRPRTFVRYAWQVGSLSKKKLVPFQASQNGEDLKTLVKLMMEGKIKTVIDSKHSLSRAEDAWAKSLDGHATGKIIIQP